MSRKSATPFDVNGRTVFITGAARGIGAETARRLHAKGANVALVGLEPDRLEELAAQLGDRAACFEVDVTDYDALQRAVSATIERFGALDVAIANAGVQFNGALATTPVEHVERTLAVNLLGVWRTDRAVIEHIAARRGYLLNISSLSAIVHPPLLGAYATAKAGVEALSDALRLESAPSGARVGCAYFGFIDTDLVRGGFAGPSGQAARSQMPGFIGRPAPLSKAIDAIEDGVERRAARVWAPRWVGPMLLLRGILQPIVERGTLRDTGPLEESLRLAEPTAGEVADQDPLLGVAARAVAPKS
ncbi:MAG TPA: short-chain dehydrogenase/reductase [Solirubrobacteraceae bacterium]|jgi:NAD(P)-dependent dehydrogenase (short-subunit alcohol dehydrogenase family)